MQARTRPLYLAAAAVLLAAVTVFVVTRLTEPDLVPVTSTGGLTIAGPLTLAPEAPEVGQTVTARATVTADRTVTLRRLTVQVRDDLGTAHDFPDLVDVEVGPTAREFVLDREFAEPGYYTYYLAYQLAGDWVTLPPWQSFRVVG
ncbi:hypothetical protein [Alloactinosynnema sp. L-07]|uniref:hypothetical protein n=1 Tax=Alloactinosynnema sp. L-07 TaxID=1653480 RepID=UPI00065EF9D2|nr:hypothetical protein [Alloactinosynnema sp. L-07]CRK58754.1 hypothetical protein [Alloactinosynnema sp. L-07]